MKERNLIITAFGPDQSGKLADFLQVLTDNSVSIIDLKMNVWREKFLIMLTGKNLLTLSTVELEKKLIQILPDMEIKLYDADPILSPRRTENVVVMAQISSEGRAGVLDRATSISEKITRVIAYYKGNIENAEIETSRTNKDLSIVITAYIDPEDLNFRDLKEQFKGIKEEKSVEIIVYHKETLSFIHRIDAERD